MVIRTTHHLKSLRVTEENEILLTSRSAAAMSAAQIQAFRRGHWTIENPIHYVRDVTFGEDRSTARTQHAPENLATLRNLVIGLCGLDAARKHKRQNTKLHVTYLRPSTHSRLTGCLPNFSGSNRERAR